mmetsp:Transcript_7354/g.18084  ORF Transcript_7354/g.18084 Transcript_7354/m.18084 type:complete len:154 (-) Transcript_7354:332-793(-)
MCKKAFCLDHRTYAAHNCEKGANADCRVVVCPVCKKGVKIVPGEELRVTFGRHESTECAGKVVKAPTCPAPGCKQKLGPANKYTCKICNVDVCLQHRYEDAHDCKAAAKAPAAAPAGGGPAPRPAAPAAAAGEKKPGFLARLCACGKKPSVAE